MRAALTLEQFIKKANEIHLNKYSYDKVQYINSTTKVIITCPKHEEFLQNPSNHLRGQGCPKCGRLQFSSKVILGHKKFVRRAVKIHGNKYDYSKFTYVNINTKGIIICPIHGEFLQKPSIHLEKKGCMKCFRESRRYNVQIFIEKANKVHNFKYDYTKVNYQHSKIKVEIICLIHGSFFQKPSDHLITKGCPHCRFSKGESKIEGFLNKNKIVYTTQKRFKTCFNKKPLRFDFYIPKLKLLIEYDGLQHLTGWGYANKKRQGEHLKYIQNNDKIKTDWALTNGFSLLRIKQSDFNNIDNILNFITNKK